MAWQPDGSQPEGWQPDGWQPSGAGDGGFTGPPRARFFAPYGSLRKYFYARLRHATMSDDDDLIFDDVYVNAGEEYEVELDLYAACVSVWRPNKVFAEAAYMRPRKPNGFAYQQMTAGGGLSGADEPFWPKTIDTLRADGSCSWKCVLPGANGILAITDPAGASTPAGLTISDVSVANSREIHATYSGVAVGDEYLVTWTFTLNGKTRKAHQRVIGKVQ